MSFIAKFRTNSSTTKPNRSSPTTTPHQHNQDVIAAFLASDSSQCGDGNDLRSEQCRQARALLHDASALMEKDVDGEQMHDIEMMAKYAAAAILCANENTRCPQEAAVEKQSLKELINDHSARKTKY